MYKTTPSFAHLLSVLFCAFVSASATLGDENTLDLNVSISNTMQSRVSANIQHIGDVVLVTEKKKKDDKPIKFLPLDVNGKITYFQKATGKNQVVRYYEKANAKIKLEKGEEEPVLGPKNRMIIARLKPDAGKQIEMASILDTLNSTELELIDCIADPLTIPALVNKKGIKAGKRWNPTKEALAKFLDVREITKSNVELLVKKIDSKTARLYVRGEAECEVDDAATKMEVSGILIIDMKENALSSMKVTVREERGPGQIAPGFEGKTQIDLRQTNNATTPFLSNDSLAKMTRGAKINQRLKWNSKSGSFEMPYDPNWKMIAAEDDAALLRLVNKGRLLAQCNVVLLPRRPASKLLSLEEYKTQVRKIAEGDKSAKMETTFEKTTTNGNKVICVSVSGEEDGVPVLWNYYHLGAPDGRQVTFVFTLESNLADRVKIHANRIVDELKFGPLPKKVASQKAASPRSGLRK